MDLPQGSSMLRAAWLSMHGFNVRAVSTVSTGRQLPLASAANDHPPSLFHAPGSDAFLDVRGIPFNFPLDIHHALAAHVCTVMLRVFFGALGYAGGTDSASITPFRKCLARRKFARFLRTSKK